MAAKKAEKSLKEQVMDCLEEWIKEVEPAGDRAVKVINIVQRWFAEQEKKQD